MTRSGFNVMGNSIRESIRGNVYILPIYLAVLLMLVVASIRSWIDFTTSLEGAKTMLIPSIGDQSQDWANVFTLAAMPQVLTIVLMYVALAIPMRDRSWTWLKMGAIVILLASIALDIYTGYLFYNQGARYPLALAGFADTAFSEIGFTIALGLTLDLLPDARKQLKHLGHRLSESGRGLSVVGGSPHKRPSGPANMKKVPRGSKPQNIPTQPPVRATQVSQSGPMPPGFPES